MTGSDMTELKKGKWSLEEDQKLISYISRYGIWNWSQMPRFAGLSRSGKSCRLRWMNFLNPNVKKGKFSKEEDEIILDSHSLLGNRWSSIASRLPGRTDNDVKNYWHTHLKKRRITVENDMNASSFKVDDDDKILQQSANHMNNVFESHLTFEDDHSSSSTCIATSKDNQVESRENYCDTGSPGTINDLQYFWDQLCPIENLELGDYNHLDVFSGHVCQDLQLAYFAQ